MASYGIEVTDNPEWIYVILDAEEKILFGIHTDGSIEWGVGLRDLRSKISSTKSSLEINFLIGKIKHTVKRVRKKDPKK